MKYFLNEMKLDPDEFAKLAEAKPREADKILYRFTDKLKARVKAGELRPLSLTNFISPVKLFCFANDATGLNWMMIWKALGATGGKGKDRPPSVEEVKEILKRVDLRDRVAILIMLSGGVRIGAFADPRSDGSERPMMLKDFEPMNDEKGRLQAVRLTVYPGETQEYFTFITPEAWGTLRDYLADREKRGEKIGPDTPILRDKYARVRSAHLGAASRPKALTNASIKSMMRDAIDKSEIRKRPKAGRIYEWKSSHGFRKLFENIVQGHMKYAASHILAGHTGALNNRGSYDSFDPKDLLADYLKAVPALTVSSDYNEPAAKQADVDELKEENEKLRKIAETQVDMLDKKSDLLENKAQEIAEAMASVTSFISGLPGWEDFEKGNKVEGGIKLQAFLDFYSKKIAAQALEARTGQKKGVTPYTNGVEAR